MISLGQIPPAYRVVTEHLQLMDGIFSIDKDEAVWADFIANPGMYLKVVDNYIANS
jgi:hypothetical protein